MGLDDEDPLLLFGSGKVLACLGDWKNERLEVSITEHSDGRLILESGRKELELTEVGFHEWSVAEVATPENQVYLARVCGFGRNTELSLAPARRGEQRSDQRAILRRVEHLKAEETESNGGGTGTAAVNGRNDGSVEAKRSRSPGSNRGGSRGRGSRSPPAGGGGRSRSFSRKGSPQGRDSPRRGGGGGGRGGSPRGGRGGRSFSRGRGSPQRGGRRSRSPPRRGRSPRGQKGGGGKGANDEVTTLFLSGLPHDVREDEVREECERLGGDVKVMKVILMRRGSENNSFVRYETVKDAQRAMERMMEGTKVCGAKVKAEMARRNTN